MVEGVSAFSSATGSAPARRFRRTDGFKLVGALVALMWVSEMVDVVLGGRLDGLGIEPRDLDGLIGVVLGPFLHVGFGHLVANTIPFLVMGGVIALAGALRVAAVAVIVGLISGLGTWLIAPESTVHIGASGLVFGFATYLVARGVFNRDLLQLVVGAAVVLMFGTALLGGLVPQQGISWQAHFFGAAGGIAAARVLAHRREEHPARA